MADVTTWGAAPEVSGPQNLISSFLWWLHGTRSGTAHDAPATINAMVNGSVARQGFHDLYPSAAEPLVRGRGNGADDNPMDILRNIGSPLVVIDLPAPELPQPFMGGDSGIALVTAPLTLFCAVWRDAASGTYNIGATRVQLANAMDQLNRLLMHQDGTFSLYDFSNGTPAWVCEAVVTARAPLLRADDFRCEWTLTFEFVRGCD